MALISCAWKKIKGKKKKNRFLHIPDAPVASWYITCMRERCTKPLYLSLLFFFNALFIFIFFLAKIYTHKKKSIKSQSGKRFFSSPRWPHQIFCSFLFIFNFLCVCVCVVNDGNKKKKKGQQKGVKNNSCVYASWWYSHGKRTPRFHLAGFPDCNERNGCVKSADV